MTTATLTPAPTDATEWITVQEAAERYRCSTKTIRRWIYDGLIKAKRIGPRLIRIDANSLENMGETMAYRDNE
ncbi:excisionase family DNA binding protein [Rhodoglobus vestalii]|uniref:Excisionase family DNA binding protein n=1 Tax=Rhodoglobus vestalii TaxID=193384 RepID=A0A8H2PVU6_9MICO|nr:helix-turn-helix domain-containing protein [Rhodoglobus vestalii]TQO18505.1 excisionase family DNA binding protein [Rhodoglobus vestalii]